ncbi:MAG: hypothetical protein AAGJ40_24310, partial [Planctomycetota bacterium]
LVDPFVCTLGANLLERHLSLQLEIFSKIDNAQTTSGKFANDPKLTAEVSRDGLLFDVRQISAAEKAV